MSLEDLLKQWPITSSGEPEAAVLLESEGDFAGFAGLHCSMLEAFGIPYLTKRSGPGQIGFLYGGFSPEGVRIYVPRSRLEEAQTLLAAAADPAVDVEDNKEEGQ